MATGHPQAYFDSDQVLASSPELDPGALLVALPAHDGLRVSRVEGVGLVAAQRTGEFTHLVAGLDGAHAVDLTPWDDEAADEFGDLTTRAVDLGFLADAPSGVATRLLDAALAGPVVFYEPDEPRRREWIAWITYALPGGAAVTFSTAGDADARLRAVDEPADAIDATEPCDLTPSFYARVALELALRGELREVVSRLEAPDGLALAVHGGLTDRLAPHQLPLALQLITELATAGHVREAARAAAALPTGTSSTSLVVREEILVPELVEPEPAPEEEIPEADVVEEDEPPRDAPIPDDVVVSVPFEVEDPQPLPDQDAWSNLLAELQTGSVQPDERLPVLPERPSELSYDLGISLDAFAANLNAAPEPQDGVEIVEEELGMSLAELEESLKRERPQ